MATSQIKKLIGPRISNFSSILFEHCIFFYFTYFLIYSRFLTHYSLTDTNTNSVALDRYVTKCMLVLIHVTSKVTAG